MIGPTSVLSWVMLVGLVILGPIVAVSSVPLHLQVGSFGLLVVVGVTNVLGLLLAYRALRIGKVGVIAPVLSTQGAVAALIAVAAGESIGPGAAVALGVIAAGVFLTAATPGTTRDDLPGQPTALVFARHGIAVTAVLASSFPAFSALAAYVLFREKLGRLQVAGGATSVIGVLLLGGVRA